MIIAAQQAIIKTASVEIKSLTLVGKQVTQAVFRQLDTHSLLDYQDAKLNGIPWGRVNYCFQKDCKDCERHLHIVWQKGSNLYQDRILLIPEVLNFASQKEFAAMMLFEKDYERRLRSSVRAFYNMSIEELSEDNSKTEKFEEELEGYCLTRSDVLFHKQSYEMLQNLDLLFIAV